MRWSRAAIAATMLAGAAQAQDTGLRELCSDRPGLGTPACTVDPGHLQVEAAIGSWTLDRQSDVRTDTVEAADIVLRYGVGQTTELRLEWTAYGHVRERDRLTGEVRRSSGIGDVTVGVKQNLLNPSGSDGLSVALLPFATLPAGHAPVGAGDWGAGLIVPVNYALSDAVAFELTPEVDAAVNESGDGRHLAYGTVVGVQLGLTRMMHLTPELQFVRDRDPEGHATLTRAALSLDVQPQETTQFDVQAVAGLNHATPDLALEFGVTRKF